MFYIAFMQTLATSHPNLLNFAPDAEKMSCVRNCFGIGSLLSELKKINFPVLHARACRAKMEGCSKIYVLSLSQKRDVSGSVIPSVFCENLREVSIKSQSS